MAPPADVENKIAKLDRLRKVSLTRLEEIYSYGFNNTNDQFYKQNFLVRSQFVDKINDEFQENHNAIISLISTDAEFQTNDQVRAMADKYFYAIKSKVSELNYSPIISSAVDSSNQNKNIRLPKINVPLFEGNIKSWPAFYDLYRSIIHENTSLSNIEKFHYLLTSLKNEPFNLIKSIPMTDNNYIIAFDTLIKRYQNTRFLATTYFNEIYSVQCLQKATTKELRHLLNIFTENLAALKALKFNTDSWDFIIFNILLQKLDSKTRTNFEIEHSNIDMPTYTQLVTFLEQHCKALESIQSTGPSSLSREKHTNSNQNSQSSKFKNFNFQYSSKTSSMPSAYVNTVDDQQRNNKCVICASSHALYRCMHFLEKNPNDRLAVVQQRKLCRNCLRPNHSVRQCPSSSRCKTCGLPHHSTLHLIKNLDTASSSSSSSSSSPDNLNTNVQSSAIETPPPNVSQSTNTLHCSACTNSFSNSTVMLSTAVVEIKDAWGNFQKVRILLDTASMANFISEKCVNRLGLRRHNFSTPIEGINDITSSSNKGITQCLIKPCGKPEPTFTFEAIVLPKVCSEQPKLTISTQGWSHIKNLPLADNQCHIPGPIDILVGAEIVPYVLGSSRIFGQEGQPVALETVFGWILQGKTTCVTPNTLLSCHASLESQIDFTLRKFWEIEQPPVSNIISPDDLKCENIYKQSVYREQSGKFVVPLPFKHSNTQFGDTYTQAYRRFKSLENRLYRISELQTLYSDFINEYHQKNYISEVPSSDYQSSSAYYLPHHCILKPDSISTKIRVVFDASAKDTKGISLNDTLYTGPKLHQDLSTILHTFRTYPVVFSCDIKQMYCQIYIKPEHRKYQRFLWRFSNKDAIKEYTLNVITFGVSSAPFLALRTLKELATLEQKNHPLASEVLKESIYVDDIVSGADSVESAINIQSDLIKLLKKGGFELGKWTSNHPALLSAVPSTDAQIPLTFDNEGPIFVKLLGLQWNPRSDVFSYKFTSIESKCTKRSILSQTARIFDPLGYIAPLVFMAKYIIQLLWLSKLGWDDEPSDDIVALWDRFKYELPNISQVQLPRMLISKTVIRLEIHCFCDASTKGYGCVIYFRYITSDNQIQTRLISAKSRVAPLRVVSLPRLELCAAYLLTELLNFIKNSYAKRLTFNSVYAWSDSQVTLAWLSSSPHQWKTFVANRVAFIQETVSMSSWRYVPSEMNPADCVSRGLSPLQLLEHKLWWQGPDFLLLDPEHWPKQPTILVDKFPEITQEERKTTLCISVETPSVIGDLLSRFSSLKKIQRILAYVLRFISIMRKTERIHKKISIDFSEMDTAFQIIIKDVQKECFNNIIRNCEQNTTLPKHFRKLAPFIDKLGILRVGGRLRQSSLSFDAKHPILLPKTHRFTDLLIEQIHQENLHPGLKTLQNLMLQHFWIISSRNAIFKCISKCIKCFRSKPRSYLPFMADLPSFRVSQMKAFSQVSLDYAGPFSITMGRYRGAKVSKAYICLFVCGATKAIHLELSSDLSTDTFLASFRRFIARRGRVSDIYSDQGTNLKGAYNQLTFFAQQASEKLSIKWHFNPPGAPHFNGLSEAGVKSVKTHLYRVIGDQLMTFEELSTLLTQIEALLNSRPLTAISEDPNDLAPLTPGHFLTMEPLSSFPEPDLSHVPINRLSRWQMLQKMHIDFWKRWSQEYLHTLQQRSKWTKSVPNITLNTLVLIKDEQRSPLNWSLGRVAKLHPGKDGIIRVVTLKTQNGTLQRPVVKVCPLPGQ